MSAYIYTISAWNRAVSAEIWLCRAGKILHGPRSRRSWQISPIWANYELVLFYISLLLEKNWEGPTKLGFLPWRTCCKKRQIQSLRPFTSNIESYYNFRMNSRNRCPLKFWTTFPVLTPRNAFCVKTNFRATSQVKSTRIIVRFITFKISVVSMWIKEVGNNW